MHDQPRGSRAVGPDQYLENANTTDYLSVYDWWTDDCPWGHGPSTDRVSIPGSESLTDPTAPIVARQ